MIDGEEFLATGMKVEKRDEVPEKGKRIAESFGIQPSLHYHNTKAVYYADDIHRLLGEGVEHFVYKDPSIGYRTEEYGHRPTHSAYLIGIKPIKEALLRELFDSVHVDAQNTYVFADPLLRNKIKKLLEE